MPLAFAAAVLLRPGHPEPAALADLAHEGAALRRVDELRHVLARDVHDLGVTVLVDERVDLLGELSLLLGELEVHAPILLLRVDTPAAPPASSTAAGFPPGRGSEAPPGRRSRSLSAVPSVCSIRPASSTR